MPFILCQSCRRHTRARRELLGRSVHCPRCNTENVVRDRPLDFLSRAHPAGLWAGRFLIALALVGGGWAAWAVWHAGPAGTRPAGVLPIAYSTTASLLTGLLLVYRNSSHIITHCH
jgi:hypothetical protein